MYNGTMPLKLHNVMQAVKNFEVTLSTVHKSSRACQAIVGAIARAACFKAPQVPASSMLPSLQETCSKITVHHQEVRPLHRSFTELRGMQDAVCWPRHACYPRISACSSPRSGTRAGRLIAG